MFKVLVLFFISLNAYSYVDLDISYTLSERKVDGIETDSNPDPGAAKTTIKGYTINWAWYIWEYTAIEFNYSETNQRLLDDREVSTTDAEGDAFTIKEQDSTVITQVSGVGIRQAFASRKARIIPSLAIGYAQYTTSGTTKYLFDFSGLQTSYSVDQEKEVFNSGYVAFAVRFRFTEFMGLSLSAKYIAPDFDQDTAQDNVTYSAGFSWLF